MAVGLRLNDQLAVDHIHSAGESKLPRMVWQELDAGLGVGRKGSVDREVRKDHSRRALAALLAIEDDSKWNSLANPDQVGRVAALDGHLDLLDLSHQLRRARLLGAEEEPAQQSR